MGLIHHHIVIIGLVSILSSMAYGQFVQRKSPTTHYREMSCAPLPNAQNIQAYDCIFTKLKEPIHQCVYKNHLYNEGENIPGNGCSAYCFCSVFDGSSPSIICAVVDCAEFFEPWNSSCIYQYTLKDCCSVNKVCDPREIRKLAKCVVDGTVYLEGQRFYPKGTCKTCVCGKGFRGNMVAPFCQDIDCGIETYGYSNIQSKCAPIYRDVKNNNCCPIGWECNNGNVTIIRSGRRSNYRCQFGNRNLNIGDKVITSNRCLSCSCDYPPLVTCIQQSSCTP